MSYSDFEKWLDLKGRPRTDVVNGERALSKRDALKAISLLSDTDVAVLGGDVYELESDGYFHPTYDNWYCNKRDYASNNFVTGSRKEATDYLVNYDERGRNNIWYVLVI